MTWGNHDIVGEGSECPLSDLVRYLPDIRLDVLNDRAIDVDGIVILGTPWSRDFYPESWAFNCTEEQAARRFGAMPRCDILVSHGPPYGYADKTESGENVGFRCMREYVHRERPTYTFCGHIHECGGERWAVLSRAGEISIVANVSYLDVRYKPRLDALEVFELESENCRACGERHLRMEPVSELTPPPTKGTHEPVDDKREPHPL